MPPPTRTLEAMLETQKKSADDMLKSLRQTFCKELRNNGLHRALEIYSQSLDLAEIIFNGWALALTYFHEGRLAQYPYDARQRAQALRKNAHNNDAALSTELIANIIEEMLK
jgi:hypothetical protein